MTQRAYKIDETDHTRRDLSEVLQVGEPSAAVFGALAGQTDAKAAVVARALRQAAKDRLHLVRQLGLPPERIRALVGAPGGWSRAEPWLVPPAAQGRGVRAGSR